MNNPIGIKGLYPNIIEWMRKYLKPKYKGAIIEVYDSHSIYLSKLLQRKKLHTNFKDFDTYAIKVDLTAIITDKNKTELAFVEVKSTPITLKDVGQLLGYCRIADPLEAFLISPKGMSTALHNLLIKYGKIDILGFNNKTIKIARWNIDNNDIDYSSIIPRGK